MKKALLISLFLFGCTKDYQSGDYTPKSTQFSGTDLTFFDDINTMRGQKGLLPLKPEYTLTQGCTKHAYDMSIDGYPSHEGFWQRYTDSYSKSFGEVVAYGFTTPEAILTAYESSPSHNAVLINPNYTHIGIAHYGLYQCVDLAGYKNNKKSDLQQPIPLVK